jgi:integrase
LAGVAIGGCGICAAYRKTPRIIGLGRGRDALPLPDVVADALRRHLIRREQEQLLAGTAWKESGRVFTSTIGKPLDGDNLTKAFQEIATEAKVPMIRLHDLRHTCGTFLRAQGVSPFTIEEILGYSQLSATRRYTHVNRAVQKSAQGWRVAQEARTTNCSERF